ncbi:helix-turn-helix transcriptional regulator [Tabrizicola sp.]|uniref:helix-turn-helix domain-containing protein n=1 Tax=Tabrizicola sp. TaxID=2005166 RepID=UPI00260721B3|nr:helix-turn-helix transcriptional regulator [Tabrizicola sp.]MDM7933638.1 helix-turn-helix transcriptional regulator [Tabrizicola sp.]
MMDAFGPNLRLLCGYRPSISRVAQDLKVNRSQLNRYLAGSSFPRGALMRRICDYFGVEPHEVVMPEEEFAQIVKLRGLASDTLSRTLRQHFDRILTRNDPRIFNLLGTFFEYYFSMSSRGQIVRSVVVVSSEGDHVFYRRLERMGAFDRPCHRHYRYQGTALMTGDRIFLNDYEYSAGIEITQTVLYPDYSHRWTRLHGVKVGVSANRDHVPCCVRTYMERTPPRMPLVGALRRCGLFQRDSLDIPDHVRPMIDNYPSGPHVFEAFSDDRI